ncbi:MAG: YbhN family protein [Actinomycetales bacterium]|nr:YbhN family protein [Actinomycetales bacterium]
MSQQSAAPALDRRKSIILGVVGLAVIVVIFWKVIPQIGSYSQAWDALQGMGWAAMAGVVLTVVVYLTSYGFPFMAATPGLRYWPSQQVNQAAFAISNGVPAGGALGLAVQFGMLTSHGIPAAAATSAITAVGIWSTFVSLGFPILGVAALSVSGQSGPSHAGTAVIGVAILVAAVLVFVLVMRSQPLAERLGSLGNRLARPLGRRFRRIRDVDLVKPLTAFRTSMYDLLRRRWAAITVAQVAVSATQFLILYVALRGIEGWDTAGSSILVVFAAFAISQLGLMVPITPGGLGTVDAIMIGLLTSFGVDSGNATAADLVWRASSYVPQIVIGILALVSWYRSAGRMLASAGRGSAAAPGGAGSGSAASVA